MEKNEYYMVILCLCILLILTLSYKPPIKEGVKGLDIGKEIKNSVLKPIQKETAKQFNKAKEDTTKEFNKAKKITEKVANDAKKNTTKEFNKAKAETTKGLNVVKKETTKGLNVVKKGTEKIANDVKKGFDDIFKEVINIANYVVCGFNKIKTLPECVFWYFLDIIYGVFYLFYSMLVLIVPPLKDIGKMLGKGAKMADGFIYKVAGFHLFRYPKDVMNKCYLCKVSKKKR